MQAIYKHVNHLANNQRQLIDTLAADKGYSGAQSRLLHYLFTHNTEGVCQKDLEREFGFRASTATELLNTMEKQGLVKRVLSKIDARRKNIVLTDDAERYRDTVLSGMEELQQTLVAGIKEENLAVWLEVTEQMLTNMKQKGRK